LSTFCQLDFGVRWNTTSTSCSCVATIDNNSFLAYWAIVSTVKWITIFPIVKRSTSFNEAPNSFGILIWSWISAVVFI
jgi:hypothetical protein